MRSRDCRCRKTHRWPSEFPRPAAGISSRLRLAGALTEIAERVRSRLEPGQVAVHIRRGSLEIGAQLVELRLGGEDQSLPIALDIRRDMDLLYLRCRLIQLG